jgi:hypothetical protein
MRLVQQKKEQDGRWEVAWIWLPHFLTLDVELQRYVDKQMTEKFRGRVVEDRDALADEMHLVVVDLIVEKYPIKGLRQLLGSYSQISADEVDDEDSAT